jgi:hypothetical protein
MKENKVVRLPPKLSREAKMAVVNLLAEHRRQRLIASLFKSPRVTVYVPGEVSDKVQEIFDRDLAESV